MTLRIVPIELAHANAFIEAHHRHHGRVQGHRFSLGAVDGDGRLVGVCVVGRPVNQAFDHAHVVEVTRLATDGTRNACSLLYAAAARTAKEMGFAKIQTYILADEETGVSLRASGWTLEGRTEYRPWTNRPGRAESRPVDKTRWAKVFREPIRWDRPDTPDHDQITLWDAA